MQRLTSSGIGFKIALPPTLILILSLGVSTFTWHSSKQVVQEVNSIATERLPEAQIGTRLFNIVQDGEILVKEYLNTPSVETLEAFAALSEEVSQLQTASQGLNFASDDTARLRQFEQTYQQYHEVFEHQLTTMIGEKNEKMLWVSEDLVPHSKELLRNIQLTSKGPTKTNSNRVYNHLSNALAALITYSTHQRPTDLSRAHMEMDGVVDDFHYLQKAIEKPRHKEWAEHLVPNLTQLNQAILDIEKELNAITALEQGTLRQQATELRNLSTDIQTQVLNNVQKSTESAQQTANTISYTGLTLSLIAMVIGALLSLLVVRSIVRPVREAVTIADGIAKGDLDQRINPKSKDEAGQLLHSLGAMQSNLKQQLEDIQTAANESLRIQTALDSTSSGVMMTDLSNTVVYINESLKSMLKLHENSIRNDVRDFSVETLIGKNSDSILKTSARANHESNSDEQVVIGGQTFSITASPVRDKAQERVGTVIEWANRTAQLELESEVAQMINQAKAGNLNQRIPLANKKGFYHTLSQDINALVEVNEAVLTETVDTMYALSQGDLSTRIQSDHQGLYRDLKGHINQTVDRLTDVISNIKNGAVTVKDGSMEISQGNANLSLRTEEQSANLERSVVSMKKVTTSVKRTADNAFKADELATTANEMAQSGGKILQSTMSAMEEINQASQRIKDIITVIDEIAFQTNLLALNAAVEAAHAGDQGRGFAIVASEVRNLAQRSSSAADEIKELINDSVSKIGDDSKLVNESGDSLNAIISEVIEVSTIIKEISTASAEQSRDIEEMNQAICEIDMATQHNAALVEQTAAASERLDEQASHLSSQVGFFQLDQHQLQARNGTHAHRLASSGSRQSERDILVMEY